MEFGKHEFERQTVDMLETGFNLRKIREEKKIPVSDVSKYLGISEQAVYNWEIGKSVMNTRHLVSLCDYYDITYTDVIKTKTEIAEYCDYDE